MSIEERVRQLCKIKGIRMSELAKRVDVTQSNLVASLRNNPRFKLLEDIAFALSVRVADILEQHRTDGIAIINGETFAVSKPHADVVQVPHYKDYVLLKNDIEKFVLHSVKHKEEGALCGYVEMLELFTLFYDKDKQSFNLTLCYGKGLVYTNSFPCLDYVFKGEIVKKDIIRDIFCDIEGVVPTKLGVEGNITQADIDKVANNTP